MGPHPEPAACVRDTGRKETRCANCSPQARAFSLPGKTGAVRGLAPGKNRVRARRGEEKDTVRDLPTAGARACETRGRKRHSARLARRSRAGKKRHGARLARRSRAGKKRHGARLAHRRCARRSRGFSPCPGKQKLSVGLHPERTACVRDCAKPKTGCASCPPQARDLLGAAAQAKKFCETLREKA